MKRCCGQSEWNRRINYTAMSRLCQGSMNNHFQFRQKYMWCCTIKMCPAGGESWSTTTADTFLPTFLQVPPRCHYKRAWEGDSVYVCVWVGGWVWKILEAGVGKRQSERKVKIRRNSWEIISHPFGRDDVRPRAVTWGLACPSKQKRWHMWK